MPSYNIVYRDSSYILFRFNDTVGALVERPTAALRYAGSIPARNKYLYGLQVVVPGLAVCDFPMFVNASTVHELFLVQGSVFFFVIENMVCNNLYGFIPVLHSRGIIFDYHPGEAGKSWILNKMCIGKYSHF